MKNQFAQVGLEPANGNSFIQDVPMVEIKTNPMDGAIIKMLM